MAALTQDVQIVEYGVPSGSHQLLNAPLGAGVTVYRGSIALLSAATGYLKNASNPSSTDICFGLIDEGGPGVPNFTPGIANTSSTASTLGVTIDIRTGAFYMAGDTTVVQSSIGQTCYVSNETTVTMTQGTSCKAGIILYVDPIPPPTALGGVVVKFNVVGGP